MLMLRYAITDRLRLGETDLERLPALVALAERWAAEGIDYIQLREKDLSAGRLLALAIDLAAAVSRGHDHHVAAHHVAARHVAARELETRQGPSGRSAASRAETRSLTDPLQSQSHPATRIVINSRPDLALAAGLSGVHLTGGEGVLEPIQIRRLYAARSLPPPAISVSCHSLDEVCRAARNGVDLILFGPVFGKSVQGRLVCPAVGLKALAAACEAADGIPVLALGGVTQASIASCLEAGAKGVAAISLFNGSAALS